VIATAQARGKGRTLSILIADDEPDTVATLAAILHDEGHIVHTVTHGAVIVPAVARYQPQVCILDIEMPGESGYAVARQLSEIPEGHRPVLIAITGKWKAQSDQILAKMVGFEHFFAKPADPVEVIALLDELRGSIKDSRNAGWLTGWGVYQLAPWAFRGLFSTEQEARSFRDAEAVGFQVAYGRHRPGTDDFIAVWSPIASRGDGRPR
jgi:CheY-like chemotaxis protein